MKSIGLFVSGLQPMIVILSCDGVKQFICIEIISQSSNIAGQGRLRGDIKSVTRQNRFINKPMLHVFEISFPHCSPLALKDAFPQEFSVSLCGRLSLSCGSFVFFPRIQWQKVLCLSLCNGSQWRADSSNSATEIHAHALASP